VFTFYRAVDPVKGSWDGYGYFPMGNDDFLAFVTDAPSGASIHTPELIKEFWRTFSARPNGDFPQIQLADALNRMQTDLQTRGRRENLLYQATIAVAQKIGSQLFYCCIGDSVFQIYRESKLYRLSDSEVWDGSVIFTPEQKVQDRQKTTEIRFVGSNGSFIPISEIKRLDLKSGDLLLFHTDGIEDLLSPDHLLKIIDSPVDQFRNRMETIFIQDKVKDDATLLAVPARISPEFHAEKEIGTLRGLLETIQGEQKQLREQLTDPASIRARMEKVETTLNRIAQDVQRLNKPQRSEQRPVIAAGIGVSSRKKRNLPWLIPLVCLLAGTAAGAFLFRGKDAPPPEPKTKQQRQAIKRQVAPPEIPSVVECSYTIQKGDTLEQIASSRNLSVDQLLELNPNQKKEEPLVIGNNLMVCEAP
jgi:serine/threonine protein phosphatase PrpC